MQKIIEKLVDKFPKKLYDRVYGIERDCEGGTVLLEIKSNETDPVSYTHLTLPTILLV